MKRNNRTRGKKAGAAAGLRDCERIKLIHELKVHQVELEAQNRQLRESRTETQDALDKYQELYDFSPAGIFSLDARGLIQECNLSASDLLGYSRNDLLCRDLRLFIRPKFHEDFRRFLNQIFARPEKQYSELEFYNKKRKSFFVQAVGVSFESGRSHKKQCRIAVLDISGLKYDQEKIRTLNQELILTNERLENEAVERKQAEEKLCETEEHFRALVKASSDVVYRMSPDWDKMLFLHGKDFVPDTHEADSTWLQKYIPPDDQPQVTLAINKAIRSKSIFQLEHRILRVDGTLGWTFSRAIPIIDAKGRILEWFGMASDVTEKKRIQDKLVESQALLSGLVSAVPIGLGIAANRVVEWVNDYLLDLIGRTKEEIFGKNSRIFYSSEEGYRLIGSKFYAELKEKGRASIETEWRHKSGRVIPVFLTAVLLNPVDVHSKLIFGALDISARKQAEADLQSLNDELEYKVEERTQELQDSNIKLSEEINERKITQGELSTRNYLLELMSHSANRKEYVKGVVSLLRSSSNASACAVCLLKGNDELRFEYGVAAGMETAELEQRLSGHSPSTAKCICARMITQSLTEREKAHTNEFGSFYCSDVKSFLSGLPADDDTRSHCLCLSEQCASALIVPMRYQSRITGLIYFSFDDREKITLQSMQVLQKLSGLIAEGVNNFDLEEQLLKGRRELEAFFEYTVMPFALLNKEFAFIRVNRAFAEMCGRKEEDFLGLNYFELCDAREKEDIFRGALQAKTPIWAFGQIVKVPHVSQPKQIECDWCLSPILSGSGNVDFLVFSLNDISERRRAERKLEQAEKELAQARRMADIGTLSATVAHELRNPLAAMRMACSNIKRKAQNPLLEKNLESISIKIDESEQIISNLLFYTRLKQPTFAKVDLCLVLKDTLSTVKSRFSGVKARVKFSPRPLCPLVIEADQLQMKELFTNIIDNSFAAVSVKNGIIEVDCQMKESGIVEVLIKDNGPGIDELHLQKVFEPFFSTRAKGTGLGLSVASQIVRLHNGTISIESKYQRGTQVKICLPSKRNLYE